MLCSVGWDWMPPVRDRNMGIWQPVYLRTTGAVTIGRPKLVTNLPKLPDTSVAKLSLSLTLSNHSEMAQKGKLTVSIKPENFTGIPSQFSENVSIAANGASDIDLNADKVSQLAYSPAAFMVAKWLWQGKPVPYPASIHQRQRNS